MDSFWDIGKGCVQFHIFSSLASRVRDYYLADNWNFHCLAISPLLDCRDSDCSFSWEMVGWFIVHRWGWGGIANVIFIVSFFKFSFLGFLKFLFYLFNTSPSFDYFQYSSGFLPSFNLQQSLKTSGKLSCSAWMPQFINPSCAF